MIKGGLHPYQTGIRIRNTKKEDIHKIIELQKESFPLLAKYGNIWHEEELQSHLNILSDGQFVAEEPDGTIVGSARTLIVSLNPGYADHTWKEITANGLFTNHDPNGDSLFGADISTHPNYRHEGIGSMLYDERKRLVIKLKLRRMISAGRLFNYFNYSNQMSVEDYTKKVIEGKIHDPVLSFEIANGFRFIKVLSNYLDDIRSLNYASFIEWLNLNR
jgi:ribosomal protein S18 acetylase RimI-like enzyme